MSTNNTAQQSEQVRRAMLALHTATWFALCEGDRYTAQGRKAVANSFYNLLPMLAEVRKAIVDEESEAETAEVETATESVASPAPDPAHPYRLHLVTDEDSSD